MEPWQAFIFGALLAVIVCSVTFSVLSIEEQENAYKRGFNDGKNRKSNGSEP